MRSGTIRILTLFLLLLSARYTLATHLRAASIQVEQTDCKGLTYRITVTAYLDTRSQTPFGGTTFDDGHISFGDGTRFIVPFTIAIPRPDLGKEISVATFSILHTYTSAGVYKVNYFERDRSQGVLNITNPGETAFSASTTINTTINCNNFPVLAIPPVDRACSGKAFFHNPGASDADGDSLSYELTIPARDADNAAVGYVDPANARFYINYNKGNEAGTGQPHFSINPVTGLITWDAPGTQGEYNIAFRIIEWRRNPATEQLMVLSVTVRDMQIVVEECPNQRPDLVVPADICVEAGAALNYTIVGIDPENQPVKIEAISEIFFLPVEKTAAIHSPAVFEFVPSNPPASLGFSWDTNCLHVRDQPYQVIFKITDQPVQGIALVTFKSWTIKVIAPAPTLAPATLNAFNRSAAITWSEYNCANAEKMQVWRKVDSFNFFPGPCVSGLPKSLGYQLIAEVSPSTQQYIDSNNGKGLVEGAKYCYRVVATFALPAGGKSYVSRETCVGPIRADAPVVTHVSVESTATESGSVRVSWRSPFNIDTDQFPKPYQYEVYRAEGFSGDAALSKAGTVQDTTFLDNNLDTEATVYNYRVVVYSKPEGSAPYAAVDTSAVASLVKLEVKPGLKKIDLSWLADVPWSNVVQQSPYHYIYRGTEDTPESGLVLIDSVNVTDAEFFYLDEGAYKNQPLADDQIYCYKIATIGTYGNPAIKLQKNFSQRVCSYPENDLVPCKPIVVAVPADCDKFFSESCDDHQVSNTFHWSPSLEKGCRTDIKSYKVFAGSNEAEEFQLLATDVRDTIFTENSLLAFARCYRVTAVDGLGQESEASDIVCNDNCPLYELPNIFTPNDDSFNDTFQAYNFTEGPSIRCPRYVETVRFTVYNRWGKEIYTYQSGDGKPIYIHWNGRNNNGSLLESALYYYVAEVTFDMLDPEKRRKVFKGWVHLVH